MQPYTKIYLKHFGYQIPEDVHCEVCGRPAVDVHHIHGRGKGMDTIGNLQALCRACHTAAHSGIHKETMQKIHDTFLQKFTQYQNL